MLKNSPNEYGVISKLLHWVTALLIFGLIGLGWWMVGLNYYHPDYHSSLSLHKSLGMIALAIATMKIAWRVVTPPPLLAATLTGLQRRLATGMHHLLWFGILITPLSGYGISTSEGAGVEVFDWFAIPAWLPRSETLRDIVTVLHAWSAYGIGAFAVVHALAALKHQFVDRDGTLRRMLW